jgi:hypothetical protein
MEARQMHPKIYERRKIVAMARIRIVTPEEAEENRTALLRHYEGKLPRPENYRKKTTERLRINLR